MLLFYTSPEVYTIIGMVSRQLLHRGADGRRALVLLALVRWAGFLAILFVVLFAVFQVLVLFLC